MRIADKRVIFIKAGFGALFLAAISLLMVSCGKDDKRAAPKMPEAQLANPVPQPIVEEEEEKIYVYSGDRFRDPFNFGGGETTYQPDGVFNPQQAKLQGIIFSRQYRSALFGIPGTGNYYVTGSRLFDVMGKTVSGFKAKVYSEKVLLIDEEEEVFEFSFKDDEEETQEDSNE